MKIKLCLYLSRSNFIINLANDIFASQVDNKGVRVILTVKCPINDNFHIKNVNVMTIQGTNRLKITMLIKICLPDNYKQWKQKSQI